MEDFFDPKVAKHATFVTPDGFIKGGAMLEPLRRELIDNEHLSCVTFHQDKVFKQSVKAAITTFNNTNTYDTIDKTIVYEDGSVEHGKLDWKYRDVVINHDKESVKKIFEEKVNAGENNMSKIVTSYAPFGLKTACFRSYENQFFEHPDNKHFMKMLVGAAKKGQDKQDFYWVCPDDNFERTAGRKDEIIHLNNSHKWKVAFPEAGTVDNTSAKTYILGPGVICTGKYLCFLVDDKYQAINANKYFMCNFYRAGIAAKMTSWHKLMSWHSLVPIQDFSNDSDIDWSGSLKSIDEQLYKKYNLTDDDIDAINRFITPAPGYDNPFAYADPHIERNDFASPSLYTVSDTSDDTVASASSDDDELDGQLSNQSDAADDDDLIDGENCDVMDTVDGGGIDE